jgi:hypothetical protein
MLKLDVVVPIKRIGHVRTAILCVDLRDSFLKEGGKPMASAPIGHIPVGLHGRLKPRMYFCECDSKSPLEPA